MKRLLTFFVLGLAATWLPGVCTTRCACGEEPGQTVSLFDGKTLQGWDGDPRFWSVKDGVITGQTTADNPTDHNTFLIWRDGELSDFQLDLEFRLVDGNSGVQYRSKEVAKWVINGYQADFDAAGQYSGILYEEGGRGIIAMTGEKVVVQPDGEKKVVGKVGEPDEIRAAVKKEAWNHYTIIARGNHLVHKINGVTTIEMTDEQVDKRAMSGLLAFQVHAGPPMLVQFKDIKLTRLDGAADSQQGKAIELFNGKDLSGWSAQPQTPDTPADVWTVANGVLQCTGKPVGYLRTDRDDFSDYVLTLQWRWPKDAGNNGVLVHTSTPDALGVWPKSIEVQLGAGDAGDFWVIGTELDVADEDQRKEGRRHKNLTDGSEKPLGEWNCMEITCQGDEVIVKVNGDLVNHATNCNVTKGAICLQSEGTPIEFRDIRLTPLK